LAAILPLFVNLVALIIGWKFLRWLISLRIGGRRRDAH
jgi:hypothetical protein